jgi:hypothetical protein
VRVTKSYSNLYQATQLMNRHSAPLISRANSPQVGTPEKFEASLTRVPSRPLEYYTTGVLFTDYNLSRHNG